MVPEHWNPLLDEATRRDAFIAHFSLLAKTDQDAELLAKIADNLKSARVPNPDHPSIEFIVDRLDDDETGKLICSAGAAEVAQSPIRGFAELVSLHDNLTLESEDEDPLMGTTGVDADGRPDAHWAYHEEVEGPWVPVVGYDCLSEFVAANTETGAWADWSHESEELTSLPWDDLTYGQIALRLMAGHLFEGYHSRYLPKAEG